MADAYGVFTFSKSEDCVVDLDGLSKALNGYEWDNSGAKWIYSKSYPFLRLDDQNFFSPQYPVAIPEEVVSYSVCIKPGEWMKKSPNELTDEDWSNAYPSTYATVPLKTLSNVLSPFLDSGWIEIACVANEKLRYVYFQLLRIYADGRALSKYLKSGPSCEPVELLDSYCPLLK